MFLGRFLVCFSEGFGRFLLVFDTTDTFDSLRTVKITAFSLLYHCFWSRQQFKPDFRAADDSPWTAEPPMTPWIAKLTVFAL